ncbi:unnamed protein product, partial [Acanthocheilonema viteae]
VTKIWWFVFESEKESDSRGSDRNLIHECRTDLLDFDSLKELFLEEYGGDPIQCWLPAELASQKSWEQYAEDYCFVENTYYIPLEQNMPQSEKHRDEKLITYYQWVPFTLMLQAMLFVIPHVFWRMLNWTSNVQTRAVISMTDSVRQMDPCSEEARDIVDAIASHIYHADKCTKHLQEIFQNSSLFVIFTRYRAAHQFRVALHDVQLTCQARSRGLHAYLQIYLIPVLVGVTLLGRKWIRLDKGIGKTPNLAEYRSFPENSCYGQRTPPYYPVRPDGEYVQREDIHCSVVQPQEKMTSHYTQLFVEQFAGDTTLVLRLVTQNTSELVASNVAARLFDIFVKKSEEEELKSCRSEENPKKTAFSTSASFPVVPEAMVCFILTDPYCLRKGSLIHFQMPFMTSQPGLSHRYWTEPGKLLET